MIIINKPSVKHQWTYNLIYRSKKDPMKGYSFPCDEKGKISISKEDDKYIEYLYCESHKSEFEKPEVQKYRSTSSFPWNIKCDCGKELKVAHKIKCDCGKEYSPELLKGK